MEEKVARTLSIIALARFFSLEKTNFTCVEFFRFFVVVATPLISVDGSIALHFFFSLHHHKQQLTRQ